MNQFIDLFLICLLLAIVAMIILIGVWIVVDYLHKRGTISEGLRDLLLECARILGTAAVFLFGFAFVAGLTL